MTLLLAAIAAVVSTIIWYFSDKARQCKVGILCYLYWGATIMWFVDAIYEYMELRAEYFTPAIDDMVNDAFLGLSVVVLGMIIWIVLLLIKDPMGVVKKALSQN